MVDLAPTFLELAGATPAIAEMRMDGRSLVPWILSNTSAGGGAVAGWRDSYLIEYIATTGVVDEPWQQEQQQEEVEEGEWLSFPLEQQKEQEHRKDNSNNTFIGLRVVNATHNLAYFEFTDATTDWDFASTDFCELYDVAKDPNQV